MFILFFFATLKMSRHLKGLKCMRTQTDPVIPTCFLKGSLECVCEWAWEIQLNSRCSLHYCLFLLPLFFFFLDHCNRRDCFCRGKLTQSPAVFTQCLSAVTTLVKNPPIGGRCWMRRNSQDSYKSSSCNGETYTKTHPPSFSLITGLLSADLLCITWTHAISQCVIEFDSDFIEIISYSMMSNNCKRQIAEICIKPA